MNFGGVAHICLGEHVKPVSVVMKIYGNRYR